MSRIRPLSRAWKSALASLIAGARTELVVASPYVGAHGTDLVLHCLSQAMCERGRLLFLTDLSPLNICQNATDPSALMSLSMRFEGTSIRHLPRLHAKVYVADGERAIVTSGNLTLGGLLRNFEYGVELTEIGIVQQVRQDIMEFAELGATVSREKLDAYCAAADRLRESFEQQRRSAAASARRRFQEAFRSAEDDLVRMRLAGGAMHTVFAKTVLYLLRTHGPLTIEELHPLIADLHPDLCDDSVDRTIDGKRFGKKWKHAVRTAQQHLKKRGKIEISGTHWRATTSEIKN
ncbi:MAG TPA: phospholipase D-like domain-containing protein [Pirellulales bacterium]|nr:phospholipase D-like domain-containing protein [Pirellulales bacterium]